MIINHKIKFNYFEYQGFFEDFFIRNITNNDYILAYFYFSYNELIAEYIKKINELGFVIFNICIIFNIIILITRNINDYYGY